MDDHFDVCVGLYCGRTIYQQMNGTSYSDCGSCLRGYRVDNGLCYECLERPEFYEWLYITFMAFALVIIEWYLTEQCVKRCQMTFDVLFLHLFVLIEVIISLLVTLLVTEPIGSFVINTCRPKRLSDFYTYLFNPSPDYKTITYCTQEAVYPLYSMIFIFYAFSLVFLIFRVFYLKLISFLLKLIIKSDFLQDLVNDTNTTKTIYLSLYVIPGLSFIHAVFCGLIYYSFPYIIIIGSIISVAVHMASQLDQRPSKLFKSLFQKRNCVIISCHWIVHIYGIISLTQLTNLSIHLPLLCLAPVPTIFYIITAKFTDPNKLHPD
ncbi:JNK1/MAPK8-associated membrane protein-like [Oppia nitens]|uniref:JNK1/MAPK8-associated membrane protein-like n=1 Tax=Oppia nitens TaxID=1686743 RepID=UPI0023D99C00|nr:JNK1/MAPK8-associated membrane protein-like [Oppia nitens]